MNAFSRIGYFARETFASFGRNLAMSIACIITIAISLLMFGGALVWIQWNESGNAKWQGDVRFEIFMNVDATDTEIADTQAALNDDPEVQTVIFLSREDAYEEFKRIFEDEPDLVASTDASILPPSFRVAPVDAAATPTLEKRYANRPGVDEIRGPGKALEERLDQAQLVRWVLWSVAIILLLSSIILIIFTVRLATLARRREIEVMKLVGASNWFVRIPFMAEGGVQGFLGAVVAGIGTFAVATAIPKVFDGDGWRGYELASTQVWLTILFIALAGLVIGVGSAFVGLVRFLDV